jgi:hypothetical protein
VIFWQVIQWYGDSKWLGSSRYYFPLSHGSLRAGISSCRDNLLNSDNLTAARNRLHSLP